MALLHGVRNGWNVSSCSPRPSRSSFRTRCRVARPSPAVPADKGSVTTVETSNGQLKGNEYIAGPYGSGRLSQEGGCYLQVQHSIANPPLYCA